MPNMNISVQLKKNVKNDKYSLFPITHADNVLVGDPESNTILSDILRHIEINDITKESIIDALGYTPYTPTEVDNLLSTLETNIDWKEAVDSFSLIATTYPNPEDGWTVNVKDTNYTYRYNGVEWVPISANAIPKATNTVDGLLSKEDHIKYEDANTKKHEHPNKAVLDAITAIYTSEEKTKLSGIDSGANNYTHPDTPGNKHIPAGGSSGQILRWSADGTAIWGDENSIGDDDLAHTHDTVTDTKNGFMSSTDKVKLDGIQEGAQVNQNSISSIIVGSATISSSRATDSLTLTGNNVTLTGDAASKSVQIGITKTNVTDALGYTPYTPAEVDNKLSTLETNIDWKEAVATYENIATTYPNPEDGWTVNVKDTDYTYRYNGTEWVAISANAIPKATNSVDGLLSKDDNTKYEDANTKKHEHLNKAILDAITAIFTTEEKTKLSGIADGANNYTLPTASSSTLGGVKTTSTVTSNSGYTACPIIAGVPYYKDTIYTHPSTSGNKHIPSGGSSGQILKWSEDGTAVWGNESGISGEMTEYITFANQFNSQNTYTCGLVFKCQSGSVSSQTVHEYKIKALRYTTSGASGSMYGGIGCNSLLPLEESDTLGKSTRKWNELHVDTIFGFKTTGDIYPSSDNSNSVGTQTYRFNSGYFNKLSFKNSSYDEALITTYAEQYDRYGWRTGLSVNCSILPSESSYNNYLGTSSSPWTAVWTKGLYGITSLYFKDYSNNNDMSIGYSTEGTSETNVLTMESSIVPRYSKTYDIGSISYLYSHIFTERIYTDSFEATGSGITPPATLVSNTSSDYTNGTRKFSIGSQSYPFYQFYAQHSYRFSDGTWWNGISFTSSMSVPYASNSTTSAGRGLEIGENGLQLKVSTSVAYFNCSDGMKCSTGWYTTSDEKVKSFTDDIDIDSSSLIKLVDIIKLRSFKYRYNENSNIIGINAEELESDMISIGIDPKKYGILNIEYNTYIPRGDDNEDDKFYIKFESVSYERLSILSILKLQDMEEKYSTRLNEVENRLLLLEQKG